MQFAGSCKLPATNAKRLARKDSCTTLESWPTTGKDAVTDQKEKEQKEKTNLYPGIIINCGWRGVIYTF